MSQFETLNRLDLLVRKNIGTATSGWWNPDHAAAVATSSYDNSLNGKGGQYAKAVLMTHELGEAISSTGVKMIGTSATSSSLQKDIAKKSTHDAKGNIVEKRTDPKTGAVTFSDIKSNSEQSKTAMNKLDSFVQKATKLAADLSKVATGQSKEDLPYPQTYYTKQAKALEKECGYLPTRFTGGEYTWDGFDGSKVPVQKIAAEISSTLYDYAVDTLSLLK